MLERGHGDRQRGSERRQQGDLDLERLLDARAPWKAEDPLVVDDRDLEVVAVVDLEDRARAALERVRDELSAVGRHARIVAHPADEKLALSSGEGGSVERISFAPEVAFVPRGGAVLEGVTIAPLSRPMGQGSPFQAAIFRVSAGGSIPRHRAGPCAQILAVLEGSGEVSGADGVDEPIETGEAVFWHPGEEHELKSAAGLTALIIEGEGLEPFRREEVTA